MRRFPTILAGLCLTCVTSSLRAVDPIPESQQAAPAMQILDAYHNPRPAIPPKKLHVVYFTPADRDPVPQYAERLEKILEDIRSFYRDEMKRNGFGPKTFDLARDENGKLIIHMVKGKEPASGYPRTKEDRLNGDQANGAKVTDECKPVLDAAGISLDTETVVIFCNLADWDEKAHTYDHHSPFAGRWDDRKGLCWAVDSPLHNLDFITRTNPIIHDKVMLQNFGNVPLGKRVSMFIGSYAHEMGHSFGLPHSGERWDEKKLGKSLMGIGSLQYRDDLRGEDKGAFLNMASAMRLAARPLFNGSDKGQMESHKLDKCNLTLSTKVTRADLVGRKAALRLEGTVKGSPPVYAVIAYFDSLHDGGYRAPAATSVPDAQGRFAIEVSNLAPCKNGEVRIAICHVNGGVSQRKLNFRVTPGGQTEFTAAPAASSR